MAVGTNIGTLECFKIKGLVPSPHGMEKANAFSAKSVSRCRLLEAQSLGTRLKLQ